MARLPATTALIAPLLVISGLHAQELTGTLKKIKDSKSVVLGYRESAIPFSYVNTLGDPIGYSIDLCNAVVEEISNELEGTEIVIKDREVTSDTPNLAGRSAE